MDLEMAEKRALVSGGSRGIGLADEGCYVAVCARSAA